MQSDDQYEQTLLDIEILAVQIEEHNKHQRNLQFKERNEALQRKKSQAYQKFKENTKSSLWSQLPFLLAFTTVGLLTTRSFILGGSIGIASASLGSYFFPKGAGKL